MDDLKFKVFMCNKPKSKLKGTSALKYINWGENAEIKIKQGTKKGQVIKGFHNLTTLKKRKLWYSLDPNFGANIFIQMTFDRTFPFYYSPNIMLADKRLYEIKSKSINPKDLCLSLNSILSILFIELFGETNLGQGGLDLRVYEAKKILFIPIKPKSDKMLFHQPKSIFDELNIDMNKPIREQIPIPIPVRAEIDNLIFDELGLNRPEFFAYMTSRKDRG